MTHVKPRCVQLSGLTDVGCVRQENEDAIHWSADADSGLSCIAVCDGMGGHSNGAMASRLAVESINSMAARLPPAFEAAQPMETQFDCIREALAESLQEANRRILAFHRSQGGGDQMGTTAVVALVWSGRAWVANVGDSRAYLWNRNRLLQVTRDHSLVQDKLESGELRPEDVDSCSFANVITRAVGAEDYMEVDIFEFELPGHCFLLLCSDGLTRYLSDDEMAGWLQPGAALDGIVGQLVRIARERGGADNISAVVAEFDGQGASQ
jgi:protein phosphatase